MPRLPKAGQQSRSVPLTHADINGAAARSSLQPPTVEQAGRLVTAAWEQGPATVKVLTEHRQRYHDTMRQLVLEPTDGHSCSRATAPATRAR